MEFWKRLSSQVLIIIITLLNSGFSLYFLFVKLLTMFIYSSPELRIFMIITLNSLWGRLPISSLFVPLLEFYLIPSSGIYFSVASFCLLHCFYFYLVSLIPFLILERWLYVGDILYGVQHCTVLWPPNLYALAGCWIGLCEPFCYSRLTTMDSVIGVATP